MQLNISGVVGALIGGTGNNVPPPTGAVTFGDNTKYTWDADNFRWNTTDKSLRIGTFPGAGTNSPTKLKVVGDSASTTEIPFILQKGNASNNQPLFQIRASSGNTIITQVSAFGSLEAVAGVVGAPGLSFVGDNNTGFYNPVADTISVALGGAQKASFVANDLELLVTGGGLIVKSPDGTRWRITVTNAGAFTATSL